MVVLDEIEKAHRDVQMLLLQVLEEGRLTDGRGRQIDFSNAVVVLTTNLGAGEATRASQPTMGFGAAEKAAPRESRVLEAARGAMPPELWNRLDERLVFPSLTRDQVARVAALLLAESAARLHGERRIRYLAAPEVAGFLLDHGGYRSDARRASHALGGAAAGRGAAGREDPGRGVRAGGRGPRRGGRRRAALQPRRLSGTGGQERIPQPPAVARRARPSTERGTRRPSSGGVLVAR